MKIKVGFVSLGCPKNLINTEVMISDCLEKGCEIVADDIDADVMVINTCAFIKEAKEEAIENILDVAWLKKHKNLKGIVVAGCLPERYREEVFKELPEVDAIIGTGSFDEVTAAVEAAFKGEKYTGLREPAGSSLGGNRVVTTPGYFAYLKIAEGCGNHCSFCAIPKLRGPYRSREMSDIVEEAKELAGLGVSEVCLVAQDTSRYGEDIYGTTSLQTLIRRISDIEGIKWIRLMYCYPEQLTDGLINEFAENPKLVKYIDLPIQHIDEDILKRMNRRGGREVIVNAISRLRERAPSVAIRTSLIVGFPGESEEQFLSLLEFVKSTRFERLGVFEYSREENTPAYSMPGQVGAKTKKRRRDEIMKAQMEIHKSRNESKIGLTLEVICEGYDKIAESYYGRSQADAPDIDGKVYFSSDSKRLREGEYINVKITESLGYDLLGKAVFGEKRREHTDEN